MALPINIKELIHGNSVEWERLEFKKGWNPEEVVHTMCAFANDLNNWGGGYIVVGIDEKEGMPIFPPHGVEQNQLDKIQKETLNLAHQISPNYFPRIQPYNYDGKNIVVLWCPAGDHRAYTAPSTQSKKSQRHPYIRIGSSSIIAKGSNLDRLNELTARIPFDDRINQNATIRDFDLGLIREYLYEVKSDLFEESLKMEFEDLCRAMNIAKGPDEYLMPVNVGLLFFSKQPEKFFSRPWIELVWHQDESGRKFKEYYFKGPLHIQLREALSFIKSHFIGEQVIKHSDRAEAERFFNFPYEAIEEVLANAVYHKSYEKGSPIEIQVWPDKIEFLSFPGPIPPVNAKMLSTEHRIVAREYRNRRIGDFLKELDLTEGRGTGFPTIYKVMKRNASPKPIFKTDEQNVYFLAVLPKREEEITTDSTTDSNNWEFNTLSKFTDYISNVTIDSTTDLTKVLKKQIIELLNKELHNKAIDLLNFTNSPIKRPDLFKKLGLSNQTFNRRKYLDPLVELNWIEKEETGNIKTPNQVYKITDLGETVLKILENNEGV